MEAKRKIEQRNKARRYRNSDSLQFSTHCSARHHKSEEDHLQTNTNGSSKVNMRGKFALKGHINKGYNVPMKQRSNFQNMYTVYVNEQTSDLPRDIILKIFDMLEVKDMIHVYHVCRKWNQILLSNQKFEHLFKKQFVSEYDHILVQDLKYYHHDKYLKVNASALKYSNQSNYLLESEEMVSDQEDKLFLDVVNNSEDILLQEDEDSSHGKINTDDMDGFLKQMINESNECDSDEDNKVTDLHLIPVVEQNSMSWRLRYKLRHVCLQRIREQLKIYVETKLLDDDYGICISGKQLKYNKFIGLTEGKSTQNSRVNTEQKERRIVREFQKLINWDDLDEQKRQDFLHSALKEAMNFGVQNNIVEIWNWYPLKICYTGKLMGFDVEIVVNKSGAVEITFEDVNWEMKDEEGENEFDISFVDTFQHRLNI